MGFAKTQSAKRELHPPGQKLPPYGPSLGPPFRPPGGPSRVRAPAADPRKRAADLILASVLLLLLLPLLLVIACLIRRDGGPAFFRQTRLGAGGVPFVCLKFRTMRTDAEASLRDALAHDPQAAREWAEHRKLRRDPRSTPIGRLLRVASLDELPQLINVLRGEMSMVGPRPIMPDEVVRFGSFIEDYFRARPGLTGLWQVSGRSDLPYSRRVELDVAYVRSHSLARDAVILYRTFGAVLRRRGAR